MFILKGSFLVGFSDNDLDREFFIGDDLSIGPVATLGQVQNYIYMLLGFCDSDLNFSFCRL